MLGAWPILGLLCALSAGTLVVLGSRLTFFNDDWAFLLQRPGFGAHSLFDPHNGHLSLLPVLAYKAVVAAFGLEHQLPFRLLLAAVVVSIGILVFVFVRERAGALLGLAAAAILLFLGPAWEDLLWSFQIGLLGSLATGVAILLLIERDTPRRNLAACLLLVASISFSNLGIAFVIAATVAVLLRRRPRQLWIPGVAAALFAVWWLAYGRGSESGFALSSLGRTPFYILDSAASGLASISGLSQAVGGTEGPLVWGRPLLALCFAGVAAWLLRGNRPPVFALVVASAGVSFWLLTGADYTPGREAIASRYQLVSATFVILIAAELFRPVRLGPGALAGAAALAAIAVGANLDALRGGYDFMRDQQQLTRADLGALEIAGPRVSSDFELAEPIAGTPYLHWIAAGEYFRENGEHGPLPVDSPVQIAAAAPAVRHAADSVLVAGYGIALAPAPTEGQPPGRHCRRLRPSPTGMPRELALAAGRFAVANRGGPPVTLGLRRFGPSRLPVPLGPLAGGSSARLVLPADGSQLPWRLQSDSGSTLEVCPA